MTVDLPFSLSFVFFFFNSSSPIRDVRKFKETKKHFDKVREDMEIAQVKNAQAPRNKPHEVEEATGALSISRKCFRHLALDYVLQVRTLLCVTRREAQRCVMTCGQCSMFLPFKQNQLWKYEDRC